MRTLRQLDNAVLDASKARAKELRDTPTADLMTENEIIAIQAEMRYNDIYRQMHSILVSAEEYLKTVENPNPDVVELLKRISLV